MAGKPWHRGKHNEWSRQLRNAWNANPDTRCARCGLTRAEGIAKWGRQGEWEAGHRVASTTAHSTADYQPEHAHCNRGEGAATVNTRRASGYNW
jgi:hypothetical protein